MITHILNNPVQSAKGLYVLDIGQKLLNADVS